MLIIKMKKFKIKFIIEIYKYGKNYKRKRRVLVRKSGTEPKIRIMAESENIELIKMYFDD